MKKILRRLSILICGCIVSICAISLFTSNKEVISTPVRDVELIKQKIDYQSVLEEFEDGMLKQEGNLITFEGTQKLNLSDYQSIDKLSEFNIENVKNVSVKYNISYNYENDIISLSASTENENGNIEMDTITGTAFLNDNGEVDAIMDLDGEYILLSEMKNVGMIENCGWFKRLVKSVVKVAVVTVVSVAVAAAIVGTGGAGAIAVIAVVGTVSCATSSTQTVRANINYSNNKKVKLYDVNDDGYIIDQSKYKDWSFGFATLDEVGCEVIAVYNMMITLGKKKELYDIIYDFEMFNIDYDLGFGHLGSSPIEIWRYLATKKIKYKAYSNFEKLQDESNSMNNCKIIFSTENDYSMLGIHSIHTFYIEKINGIYYSYNGYVDAGDNDLSKAIKYKFKYAYIVE